MKSILVVRLSSLGDIILTQPVLAAIQRAGDRAELLVKPEYASLAAMLPGAARVLTSVRDLAPAYDAALDLHGVPRALRALRAARCTRVIRYDKHVLARRLLLRPNGLPVPWNRWSPLRRDASVAAWYAAAAEKAGYRAATAAPEVRPPDAAVRGARALLRELGAGRRFVALSPGAAWANKQWPPAHFTNLAARLERECGRVPVFVGGPSETALCADAARAAGGRAVSAAGRTDIPVLAALLGAADLLICNDSGPMHLGLAAGTRVVAFFGPTVPEFGFAPRDAERSRILSVPLRCRPCSLHGGRRCPAEHHRCLREITPDAAFEAARELMKK